MTYNELLKEIAELSELPMDKVRAVIGGQLANQMAYFLKRGDSVRVSILGRFGRGIKPPVTIKNNNINGGLPITYTNRKTVSLHSQIEHL